MALALLVPGLVLELLDDDLRSTQVAEDLGGHLDLRERLGVVRDRVTVDEQHGGELDVAVFVGLDAVENDDRADLDLLLTTTGAHNCVNHVKYPYVWMEVCGATSADARAERAPRVKNSRSDGQAGQTCRAACPAGEFRVRPPHGPGAARRAPGSRAAPRSPRSTRIRRSAPSRLEKKSIRPCDPSPVRTLTMSTATAPARDARSPRPTNGHSRIPARTGASSHSEANTPIGERERAR